MENRVVDRYYRWLLNFVCDSEEQELYSELLDHLFSTTFVPTMELDENRASWGVSLRDEFEDNLGFNRIDIDIAMGPCNVLELMVSLSKQIDNVLYDDAYGERYNKWFWYMVNSLGLNIQNDSFDEGIFYKIMEKFMYRKFEPDGFGSLFWLPGCNFDCRRVQIWVQKCKFETNFINNEGL